MSREGLPAWLGVRVQSNICTVTFGTSKTSTTYTLLVPAARFIICARSEECDRSHTHTGRARTGRLRLPPPETPHYSFGGSTAAAVLASILLVLYIASWYDTAVHRKGEGSKHLAIPPLATAQNRKQVNSQHWSTGQLYS